MPQHSGLGKQSSCSRGDEASCVTHSDKVSVRAAPENPGLGGGVRGHGRGEDQKTAEVMKLPV